MGGMVAVAPRSDSGAEDSHERHAFAFESVIDGICAMPWERLSGDDILCVAKAYYFFSIQFRENLEIACGLRPRDANLRSLRQGECDTDNLSPYPGVTAPGERLDHDEFMKRLLAMQPLDADSFIGNLGRAYLGRVRDMAPMARGHQHRQLRGRRLEPGVCGDAARARLAGAGAAGVPLFPRTAHPLRHRRQWRAWQPQPSPAAQRQHPAAMDRIRRIAGGRSAAVVGRPVKDPARRGPSSRLKMVNRAMAAARQPKIHPAGIKVHTASRPTDRGSTR